MADTYTTGTITVGAGGSPIVGSGTAWASIVYRGDMLVHNASGVACLVDTITDDTHIVPFGSHWPGGAVSGAAYTIYKNSPLRFAGASAMQVVIDAWEMLQETGVIYAVVGVGVLPDVGIGSNGQYAINLDDSPWSFWKKVAGVWVAQSGVVTTGNVRERLIAARTYYVRSDGSDSNTGLVNTAGGAFLTIQKAVDTICNTLDINGKLVTIQLQSGVTFTENVVFYPYIGQYIATQTNPTILGDVASPSSYIVDGGSGITFLAVNVSTPWYVKGLTAKAATGVSIEADINSTIYFANLIFPTTTSDHMRALYEGKIEALGNYTISGGALTHIIAADGGQFLIQPGKTITLTGTPAWGSSFISVALNGQVVVTSTTYTGAATGVRWRKDESGALVYFGGTSLDTLPGNAVGIVTPLPVSYGGTGAITAASARTALGVSGQATHGDSNYTILTSDLPLLAVSANLTAARTWTLPAASAVEGGAKLIIIDQGGINGANTLTVQRGGSDTFLGVGVTANAITLSGAFNALTAYSNGVNAWYLVNKST